MSAPTPTLPAGVELEQAVLGALLFDNRALAHCEGRVTAASFAEPLHVQVFEAARIAIEAGRVADPLTLGPLFANHPAINDALTVPAYLGKLLADAGDMRRARDHVLALADLAQRREAIAAAEQVIRTASNPAAPLDDALAAMVGNVDRIASARRLRPSTRVALGDGSGGFLAALAAPDARDGLATGLRDLDARLDLARGHLVVVAGRPGMGKTALALNLARGIAAGGVGVFVASLEMSVRENLARLAADLAFSEPGESVAYRDLLRGTVDDAALAGVMRKATQDETTLPVVVDYAPGVSLAALGAMGRAEARKFEARGIRLGAIVVDHLGLMSASDAYRGNRVQEVAEISAGLKALAGQLDVCVVALSQLNRGVEGRDNKRPTLADLRDSGAIEQDADSVLLAYRPAYYLERHKDDEGTDAETKRLLALEQCRYVLEVNIAKARSGETGSVELFAYMPANAIRNYAGDGRYA